jgi:hypothetical protein
MDLNNDMYYIVFFSFFLVFLMFTACAFELDKWSDIGRLSHKPKSKNTPHTHIAGEHVSHCLNEG